MGRFDDPGTSASRIEMDAGIVSLTEQFLGNLGVVMMVVVFVHVAPKL